MIYLGKNTVGISDTALVVDKETVNRINAVEIKETVSTPSSIMTITDGADKVPIDELIVGIEPLQDLHGYNSPWPGGSGKNLFDVKTSTSKQYVGSNGNIYSSGDWSASDYIKVTPGDTYTISGANAPGGTGCHAFYDANKDFISSVTGFDHMTFTAPEGTEYVRFSVKTETPTAVQLEKGSTATSWEPYENICPINGWTGCNVTRAGKNLCDPDKFYSGVTVNDGIYTSSTSGYTANLYTGQNGASHVVSDVQSMPLLPPGTYVWSFKHISGGPFNSIQTVDANGKRTYLTLTNIETSGDYRSYGFTLEEAARICITRGSNTTPTVFAEPQIELGIVRTEYEPFDSNTYEIQFPSEAGTVYGGTLTIHKDGTGTLVVDRKIVSINGTENWNVGNADNHIFQLTVTGNDTSKLSENISSTMPNSGVPNVQPPYFYVTTNTLRVVNTAIDTTIEAIKAWFSANPCDFCIFNNAAVSYELTALEVIEILKGTNNIWTDTGAIQSLKYTADPKLYVDQNKGVSDVQVNGVSVVNQGVANVPIAEIPTGTSAGNFGVVALKANRGIGMNGNDKSIYVSYPTQNQCKNGNDVFLAVTTAYQHFSVFYGLSKAAGEDLKNDTVTAGTYPEKSKSAISQMLSAPVTVSGATPSITAMAGVRYICGEVSTLSITVPESGIIDVTFTSGSTPTTLTIIPPTGMTMHWANGFDPTALEADTTYEINIMDGCYGVVGSWT